MPLTTIKNTHTTSNLGEHFTELRTRALKSLTSIALAFVFCWFFSDTILAFLKQPIQPFLKHTKGSLIFTSPLEVFISYLHIAIVSAIGLSSPYWLGQLWQFISPGLYKTEKKTVIVFWLMGCFLFLLGFSFSYFFVCPLVFRVLIPFGNIEHYPFITLKNYLSFLTNFILIFGFIFELPLLLLGLCYSGLLHISTLKKYRKHTIVLMALIAAFITPPDLLSQCLVLITLIILYELSLLCTSFFLKVLKKR